MSGVQSQPKQVKRNRKFAADMTSVSERQQFSNTGRSSLSPQREEGQGEGWFRQKAKRIKAGTDKCLVAVSESSERSHPSPLIPLSVEGRGKNLLRPSRPLIAIGLATISISFCTIFPAQAARLV